MNAQAKPACRRNTAKNTPQPNMKPTRSIWNFLSRIAETALFDRAIESGRLFGQRLDGLWMHVGTPDAIGEAEAAIGASIL